MIELQNVSKTYLENGVREITALKDVSLNVEPGAFVGLVGPSGSGKSTLLNVLGCLEFVDKGSVAIDGNIIANIHRAEIAKFRNETVGFVFQNFNLINTLSVFENIELPLLFNGKLGPKEREERTIHLIDRVGLKDQTRQTCNLLSGGQMQRVAVARALVMNPKFVLADEPTANLDRENSERILQLLRELNRDHGTTFIFATHDNFVVDQLDHTIMLQDGRVIQ